MTALAFSLAIISTIAAGFQVFVGKVVAERGGSGAVFSFLMYGVACLCTALTWLVWGTIPEAWVYVGAMGLLSGFIHGVGNIVRVDSLKYIDSTIYFPINKVLGPIIVVASGIYLLGEQLTNPQYLGVLLSLAVPLLLITNKEHGRQKNLTKGLFLLVVSTVFSAGSMVFVKLGTAVISDVLFFVFLSNLGGLIMSVVFYVYQHGHFDLFTDHKSDWSIGIISGILGYISFGALSFAYSMSLMSVVYTINAHYILVPIILSVWWYREHMDLKKFAAVVLSCVTLTLLY
jgi:drug/metabolite transporter (DMT)-like permease